MTSGEPGPSGYQATHAGHRHPFLTRAFPKKIDPLPDLLDVVTRENGHPKVRICFIALINHILSRFIHFFQEKLRRGKSGEGPFKPLDCFSEGFAGAPGKTALFPLYKWGKLFIK